MISARRISALLAKKVVEMYHAILTTSQDVGLPWQYQPLGQDTNTNVNAQPRRKHLPLRLWQLFAYTAGFLCVVAAFAVFSRGDGKLSTTLSLSRANISKDQFIAAILRDPVEGLLDPDPIRKKCNETKFQEGLFWHCAAIVGGIGNVANMWLNCVRYAIEAGGTFIFPLLIYIRANIA
jgi:hypothetical protein